MAKFSIGEHKTNLEIFPKIEYFYHLSNFNDVPAEISLEATHLSMCSPNKPHILEGKDNSTINFSASRDASSPYFNVILPSVLDAYEIEYTASSQQSRSPAYLTQYALNRTNHHCQSRGRRNPTYTFLTNVNRSYFDVKGKPGLTYSMAVNFLGDRTVSGSFRYLDGCTASPRNELTVQAP
eukprot:299472_1